MTNASPRAAVTDLVSFESSVNPLLRSALRCGLLALVIRKAPAAGQEPLLLWRSSWNNLA